jgi:hypothetical protein
MGDNPGARLVVIDVFAKFLGRPPVGASSAYEADYAAIGIVKRLADSHAVPIVLVHHVPKASFDDLLATVSGTMGSPGPPMPSLSSNGPALRPTGVLHRHRPGRGRNRLRPRIRPSHRSVVTADGPAEEHLMGDTRALIARYVRDRRQVAATCLEPRYEPILVDVHRSPFFLAHRRSSDGASVGTREPRKTPVNQLGTPASRWRPDPRVVWVDAVARPDLKSKSRKTRERENMTTFAVRVRIKDDAVPAVKTGIEEMISAIEREAPEGVRYAYCQFPDGVSFLALLELADGVENPLPRIAACKKFQDNLPNWIDQHQPPTPEPINVIGSYYLFNPTSTGRAGEANR